MKAKALVVAVDRPQVAAHGYWAITVVYVNAQGFKRKRQVFSREYPKVGESIVIDTSRSIPMETRVTA